MMWRLEAMLDHGLEGTALGTLVMPYCSGLGNLLFVGIMVAHGGPAREVLTNCLVNNVTNLTLLLGLPALLLGAGGAPGAPAGRTGAGRRARDTAPRVNRLSLLLTFAAVLFFTGAVWVLGRRRPARPPGWASSSSDCSSSGSASRYSTCSSTTSGSGLLQPALLLRPAGRARLRLRALREHRMAGGLAVRTSTAVS
jgi:hypothetical protein